MGWGPDPNVHLPFRRLGRAVQCPLWIPTYKKFLAMSGWWYSHLGARWIFRNLRENTVYMGLSSRQYYSHCVEWRLNARALVVWTPPANRVRYKLGHPVIGSAHLGFHGHLFTFGHVESGVDVNITRFRDVCTKRFVSSFRKCRYQSY